MIKNVTLFLLCLLTIRGYADAPVTQPDTALLSKTLGHLIVRQINQAGFTLDLDLVILGIQDERAGKSSPLTEEEYEQGVCTLQEQCFIQTASRNLEAANAFLAENARKQGICSIDPQLQYKITQAGAGDAVEAESIPLLHYKGELIDGTIFASSEALGQPVSLPIKQSIPGFAKGLVGMKEGEKRVLYIHPELAYGLSGQLPPNSLLIFEVEVVRANQLEEIATKEEETPVAQQASPSGPENR